MKKRSSKSWKAAECDIDACWSGTAMIYAASGNSTSCLSGDYCVSYQDESEPRDLRANRLYRRSQGQRVNKVPRSKLGNEMIIIVGANITAAKAVQTLEAVIRRIEDEGLLIGRVETGDFIHETTEKELTVKDARAFPLE